MASTVKNLNPALQRAVAKPLKRKENKLMSDDNDDLYINDVDDEFDFVDAYSEESSDDDDQLLPENTAQSAIDVAFLGIGGGGGKLAKAFIDIGFNRTLLINTTVKDQPDGIDENNFLLLPGADGVGKDVDLGRSILEENSALVEDNVRARLGSPDWIFVFKRFYSDHRFPLPCTYYLPSLVDTDRALYGFFFLSSRSFF